MTLHSTYDARFSDLAETLTGRGEAYAVATVVRTLGATAAKPGAKALLTADGTIAQGWIGGGCVRGALKKAVQRCLENGTPELIAIQPEDLLEEQGVRPGDDRDGVRFARNGCPSEGSIDIFVEPVLPQPELVIFGASPVAEALAHLAPQFKWTITQAKASATLQPLAPGQRRMVVVATQGQSDLAALETALSGDGEFCAFVASRKKFAKLAEKLRHAGVDPARIATVKAPAGLHIHAVTPEEIALSILAELVLKRRATQRDGDNLPLTQPMGA